jgi:hypothetical protein
MPGAIKVTVFMTVSDEHARWYGSHSQLWRIDLNMHVVPGRGERIMLWEDGPLIAVKERWWDHLGTCFLDLRQCVVDPDSDEQRYQSNAVFSDNWSWFSQQQGRLRGFLVAGGWQVAETGRTSPGQPADGP